MSRRHSNGLYSIARYLARQTTCSVDTNAIHMSVCKYFGLTYGCHCVTQRNSLLERQSVLFNAVRRLKHVFCVITEHWILATRFTHQHFSTLFFAYAQYVLSPHGMQHRPTANLYLGYDSLLRKALWTYWKI
jgi:hypothetical protein